MYSFLFSHIKRFIPLNEQEEQIILALSNAKTIKKKEHLLINGNVCHAHYFIVKGCCRMYLNTNEGKEQTIQFAIENWWMSDYTSFENGKSSNFNIQAIEDLEIIVIEKQSQEKLLNNYSTIGTLF